MFKKPRRRPVSDFTPFEGTEIDRVIGRLETVAERLEAAYQAVSPLIHQKIVEITEGEDMPDA
jgi:pseudouridine-5'-phosphate glycosidase